MLKSIHHSLWYEECTGIDEIRSLNMYFMFSSELLHVTTKIITQLMVKCSFFNIL